jgi:hypothetical protein
MLSGASRGAFLVLAVAVAAIVLGGCASDPFSRVALETMSHREVGEALGSDAVASPDGFTLEVQNKWPTILTLVHVAAPQDKAALWKLQLRGSVIHLVSFQTLNLAVVYEGPASPEILKGLRNPSGEDANEFQSALIGFMEQRVHESLSARWTEMTALRDDRYRSRFLGVFEVTISALRGQGKLDRSRFNVDIASSTPCALHLRHLGRDIYRIEMTGTVSLGPVPVL